MATSLNLQSYEPLPSFNEAIPLGTRDEEFIKEVYAVFAKHGNLNRFGLCLVHEHFPVGIDEILLETNDPEHRTLTSKVVKKSEITESIKMTSWRFGDLNPAAMAMTGCAEDKCKTLIAMTGCAEDKCKSVVAMTGCAEDKCKAK
ncbi:MAG TPA: hypothetical protein VHA33_22480 [Candidatus Angelobacter sp.]|jgi:hypothetical protein|nr:hypothetical protein [Candidatus Angelobacter sp.]